LAVLQLLDAEVAPKLPQMRTFPMLDVHPSIPDGRRRKLVKLTELVLEAEPRANSLDGKIAKLVGSKE
jgi:hypothetical protein